MHTESLWLTELILPRVISYNSQEEDGMVCSPLHIDIDSADIAHPFHIYDHTNPDLRFTLNTKSVGSDL